MKWKWRLKFPMNLVGSNHSFWKCSDSLIEVIMDNNFTQELLIMRHAHAALFSNKYKVHQFADNLIELLFPHFCSEIEYFTAEEIGGKFALLSRDLKKILKPQESKN